jgi:hypothetical protein
MRRRTPSGNRRTAGRASRLLGLIPDNPFWALRTQGTDTGRGSGEGSLMPDKARISQHIDALEMTPLDDEQRHRAALNVCAVMTRTGNSIAQIRSVLAALGLDRRTP